MKEIDKLNGVIDGLEVSIKKHETYIREHKRLVIKNTIERNNLMTGLNESERLAMQIATIKKTVEGMEAELEEMKKVEEVKPVFPAGAGCDFDWIVVDRGNTAYELGMTAKDDEGIAKIANWMKARKYIIEEINKVNGKRGQFCQGYSNYSFEISKRDNLIMTTSMTNKAFHDDFYVNDYDKASKLCSDNDFFEAYKVYLNYK